LANTTSEKTYPGMRKRLQISLMAASAIATLLSFTPPVWAAGDAPITPTVDDTGHKVYVNDIAATPASSRPVRSQQNRLVYWSTTDRRWKPVPRQNVQAAKSAAAEVDEYLDKPATQQNSAKQTGFTQQEIDAAIEQAATRHSVDPNLGRW
jgi:hypothetical protein